MIDIDKKLVINEIETEQVRYIFASYDLWEAVQKKLKENDVSGNHTRSRNDNLLTGKLFDTGTVFVSQASSKRKATKKHYYAIKGLYLPTEQIDKLAQEAVTELLNADYQAILTMQEK